MDAKIEKLVKEWMSEDYDEETRQEIKELYEKNDEKELYERFYTTLTFGTGGLRGIMGAGTNRMNKYVVGKATQGLANYLLKNTDDCKTKGVVIAYDNRNNSDKFALEAALVLSGNGIKVYLFDELYPTPLCSFGIRQLGAVAGIVITASHNPKEYSGYKVSYADGAQVLPPHDVGIISEVNKISSIKEVKKIEKDKALAEGLLVYIGEDIDKVYLKKVEELQQNSEINKKVGKDLKIVFTPLHGAGNKLVRASLKLWGFENVFVVPEQEKPDGNFSTVKSPNPQYASALELAIKLAKEKDADLVLATDPDADRLGIAVKSDSGYILCNGNQIGFLIAYYLLSQMKEKGELTGQEAIVKTIVSTDIIFPIAKDYNATVFEVLTGFKYIGEKIKEWDETRDYNFVTGFEESYGYLAGTFVREKDAVIACSLVAEITAWAKSRGMSILEIIDEIYVKYGYYYEDLLEKVLKGSEGVKQIGNIMENLRNNPPEKINGVKITKIRDVLKDEIKDLSTNKTEKINLPKSNVLTFYFEDGSKITARPSGTEPKIKFYFSYVKDVPEKDELNSIKLDVKKQVEELKAAINNLVEEIK